MAGRTTWRGIVVAAAVAVCAGRAAAAEAEGSEDRRTLGSDPSEIVSRLEVRNEYLGLPGGGHSNATILRGDWAPTHWLLGRLELPIVTADTEEFGTGAGAGDVLLGVRARRRIGERWSVLGEMAFLFDTAGSDALGSGRHAVAPFGVAVWKPTPGWILAVQYGWIGSFAGDDHREKIRESAIRPQALYHLPHGFWLLADPRVYVDHVEGADVAFFPEGELGNVLTRRVEVWLRGGGNVAGGGREEREGWKAEVGVRYLFE